MSTTIGLPSLIIQFRAAAQAVSNRSKRGVVALVIRDTAAQGIHQLTNERLLPDGLGQENADGVLRAFQGSDRGKPSQVILAVIDPEDTTGAAWEAALTALAAYSIDYLAGPGDMTQDEAELLQAWILEQRAAYRTVKGVLPNTAANQIGIVNFATEGIQAGGVTFSAAAYCGRIAGILAGIPSGSSATYVSLPEVTGVPELTTAQQNAAISAGKLILIHDGMKAKLARAVNSMTTIPEDGADDWKKIKIVEGMDLVTYFLRSTIEDEWLGRYSNSYDNKMLLVVAVQSFFLELEERGVLQRGSSSADIDVTEQERWLRGQGKDTASMTEQEIREADTASWVFLLCKGLFLDAMEDFLLHFNNL